jgi:hypothetical protein
MGIFGSRPAVPPPPPIRLAPNFANATLTGADVTAQFTAAQNAATGAITNATAAATQATSSRLGWIYKPLITLLGIGLAIALFIAIYDAFAPDSWPNVFFSKTWKMPGEQAKPPLSGPQAPVSGSPPAQAPLAAPPMPPPTIFSEIKSYFTDTTSTADFLPKGINAETSLAIQGNKAPLSSQKDGAYSLQWWMFIKDWNYGYGKPKSIIRRPDPTNPAILNPHIYLHPTENTMQVSVSLFPSGEGSAGKSEPAPAGSSAATDDVFVCDVTDVPLQSWFSVSVTVFGRNLDIYIDGKLVKSCFLPGVPKPASGDITLSPDGGFSGRICNFFHYSRMITPGDAAAFYSADTSCRNDSGTDSSSSNGYSVKFGVYDSLGKEVQEYAF